MGKSSTWFGKIYRVQGTAFDIFQVCQIVSGTLKMYILYQKKIPLLKKNVMSTTTKSNEASYFI